MIMTKKLIKTNSVRWAVFSTIMAVFLLAACGDTATTVPGTILQPTGLGRLHS